MLFKLAPEDCSGTEHPDVLEDPLEDPCTLELWTSFHSTGMVFDLLSLLQTHEDLC
jgi:hypothetical protein